RVHPTLQKEFPMAPDAGESQTTCVFVSPAEQQGHAQSFSEDAINLRRWLVSFSSGREWYPVGEFVALDATSAIDRAVEIFGAVSGYQAEEIPWAAAPLLRPQAAAYRRPR